MAARAGQRFPAYGKRLYERRLQGDHPFGVDVIYGDDWTRVEATVTPYELLALKPADYRPGAFDWRVVAGVYVHLIDRSPIESWFDDVDDEGYDKFFWLIGEIGRWCGPLVITSDRPFRVQRMGIDYGREFVIGERTPAEDLVYLCSRYDPDTKDFVAPRWWRLYVRRQ